MSGFGFGAAPAASGFGSNQPNTMSGGFGSASTPGNPNTGFGGGMAGGFSSSSSSGFGMGAPPAATTAPTVTQFGSSPNVISGFGSISSNHMASSNTGGGGGGGFGRGGFTSTSSGLGGGFSNVSNAPPASASGFSSSMSRGGFGGANTGSSASTGFETSPNQPTTTSQGFGGTGSGFGFGSASNAAAATTPPASNTSTAGFGGVATSNSSGFGSSGFGGPMAAGGSGGGMAFGTSSNVVVNKPVTGTGSRFESSFSSSTAVAANTTTQTNRSQWNSKSSAGNPFASAGNGFSSSTGFGSTNQYNNNNNRQSFQQSGDHDDATFFDNDDGMMDDNRQSFGKSQSSRRPQQQHQQQQQDTNKYWTPSSSPVPPEGSSNMTRANEEEAKLKAKIEEKKRVLQAKIEKRKQKLLQQQQQDQQRNVSPLPEDEDNNDHEVAEEKPVRKAQAILNVAATPFAPASTAVTFQGQARSSQKKQSLAERNAIRFAKAGKKQSASLPPDLEPKAETNSYSPVPTLQQPSGREDFSRAQALVGTCPYFCPDEELLRRQKESDIQQLEVVLPGKLHPSDWTIRNTAVKRFRRSAADYKLDVPEWVRPPDVLEQVCGYLEEWVMERDRQGPDPRFPQGQTPPPLEVYQFIWDRTRMIRKDFTLQNYVGTGGQCDARAVRCHERIARWHAMCEHQLSHIQDFTTMQSQQNIQELGQTMKTLNQFYDDSLQRSTVEVPDKNGKETRQDLSKFSHGCTSNTVQGLSPLDFDGSELSNAESGSHVAQRLIGRHAVNSPARGTAETEMRGLYMLLTMNNEGGMEVLKYAARLFQERPEIYHSKPVQLALEIFKAKKEYNYARFFSILRAPTTPYLFCCIMFKHVELMRKVGLRIMSKAFGARKKDTGEAIYDAYPLSRLVELLCFEDLEEARNACQHYNITVKLLKSSSRDEVTDVIFWKGSEFQEPTHPEKGFVIPLQPKKMIRIIESKLKGATRLAVCRGEVSGDGATLQSMPHSMASVNQTRAPAPTDEFSAAPSAVDKQARAAALLKQQQLGAARQEETRREKDRLEKERKKAEEERIRREKQEEKERELERQRLMEMKEEEEEAARQAQREKEEAEKRAAQQRAREEARKQALELEAKRRAEEERRRAEEEAKRRAEEERRKEEEARIERERQQRILEEKKRQEEARRQEILRRELEAKRKREAEERRKAKEWEDKVNAARKLLMWKRWRSRVARRIEMTQGSKSSLSRLDPTFSGGNFDLGQVLEKVSHETPSIEVYKQASDAMSSLRRAIETSIQESAAHQLSLAEVTTMGVALSDDAKLGEQTIMATETRLTLLLKVALMISVPDDSVETNKFLELLRYWLHAKIGLGKLSTYSTKSGSRAVETRSVVHFYQDCDDCSDCDIALVLVPHLSSISRATKARLQQTREALGDSVPRVVLALGQFNDHADFIEMKHVLAECLGTPDGSLSIICNRNLSSPALSSALEASCKKLAAIFVNETCVKIDRMSLPDFAARLIAACLWRRLSIQECADCNYVLTCARSAIDKVIEHADELAKENEDIWKSWPPSEFLSKNGVEDYFTDGSHLPVDWKQSLRRVATESDLHRLQQGLTGSFRDVIESLVFDAPKETRADCLELISNGFFRRSLQLALEGFVQYSYRSDWRYVYFPRGTLEILTEQLASSSDVKQDVPCPALMIPRDSEILDVAESIEHYAFPTELGDLLLGVPDVESFAPLTPAVAGNKRRLEDSCSSTPAGVLTPSEPQRGKRRRNPESLSSSKDLDESAAFTQKLQNMLNGETVDTLVGDHYLSTILRDVPQLGKE